MKKLLIIAAALLSASLRADNPKHPPVPPMTVSGQLFLQDDETGPFICGGVTVYLFESYVYDIFVNNHADKKKALHLPAPIASTVTDADGRFSITIPKQPYCLYTEVSRSFHDIYGHKIIGFFLWDLSSEKIEDPVNMIITQANCDIWESARRTKVTMDHL